MNNVTITHIDRQKKSVWLSNGQRVGFAAIRKMGVDIESANVGTVVA